MSVAWFVTFRQDAALADADRARIEPVLAATPAVARVLIHTPASTRDPYLDDGRPPVLALQLYFVDLAGLDAAQRHLQVLATPDALPSLRGAAVTQQAMLARAFAVPAPCEARNLCSYLVAYDGEADDPDAWIAHYNTHHTAIMARFPAIRDIEVCTRLDWHGALPWPHVDHMLRNKVVFDDPPALTAALNSPVRHDMRADYARFGRFTGQVTHFPMHTTVLDLPSHAAKSALRQGGR
jgi:hypothetical protein